MIEHYQPVDITPEQFERQVHDWIKLSAKGLKNFVITHLHKLKGDSGEYEIDAMAEFEVFDGAAIKVLVECKRYKSAVKRDVIMILESKIRDTNSHKGIVFSTSGFQKGAIEYAQKRGIATVTVQNGNTNYFTKAQGHGPAKPPPWVKLSKYIGWFTTFDDKSNPSFSLIDDDRRDPLVEWFKTNIKTNPADLKTRG